MDNYKITFQTWNKVAALYQEHFMDIALYNDTYDEFCSLIVHQYPRVFEIGCGPGCITKYILSKRPDFKIKATDVAPNMIALAKENIPGVNFEIMDCREIDQINDKFDGIMCGFCLPYLSREDSVKLIKDSSGLLNAGGIFYFSTIEDNYTKSGWEANSMGDKVYVYYHEEAYLQKALEENSFELISLQRKSYPKGEATQVHMIFIAKKK